MQLIHILAMAAATTAQVIATEDYSPCVNSCLASITMDDMPCLTSDDDISLEECACLIAVEYPEPRTCVSQCTDEEAHEYWADAVLPEQCADKIGDLDPLFGQPVSTPSSGSDSQTSTFVSAPTADAGRETDDSGNDNGDDSQNADDSKENTNQNTNENTNNDSQNGNEENKNDESKDNEEGAAAGRAVPMVMAAAGAVAAMML